MNTQGRLPKVACTRQPPLSVCSKKERWIDNGVPMATPCYADAALRREVLNLTITVDDELLKRARIRALEENTTVNAVLRKHLERYAETTRQRRAVARLLHLSQTARAKRGAARWNRDELHGR